MRRRASTKSARESELDHDNYTPSSASSPRVPNVSAQPAKFGPQFRRPRARGVRDPERPTQADYENPAWSEFSIAKDAYTRSLDLIQLQGRALKATPAGERSSGRQGGAGPTTLVADRD